MNDGQKAPEVKFEPKTEFGKKLDNFWYYNKWKVIVGIFILAVLVVCIIQCSMQDKTGVDILYCGGFPSSDKSVPDMQAAFVKAEPESTGKNGVGIRILETYDDDYLKELIQEAKEDTSAGAVNVQIFKDNYTNFTQLVTVGEYSLLLLDKWVYDSISKKVPFRTLDDVFGAGTVSDDIRYDGATVIFKKTDFFKANQGAFSKLPDDVVLCLCVFEPYKSSVSCGGSNKSNADYDAALEMFKSIINYKVK